MSLPSEDAFVDAFEVVGTSSAMTTLEGGAFVLAGCCSGGGPLGLLLLRELLLWFLSLLLSLLLPLLSLLRSDELHVTNDMGETALVREEDIASSASSAGSVCCCFCCNREVVVAARVGDGRLFDDEAVAALMTRVVDASWFSVDDNTDFEVPARLPSPLRRLPLPMPLP